MRRDPGDGCDDLVGAGAACFGPCNSLMVVTAVAGEDGSTFGACGPKTTFVASFEWDSGRG